MTSGWLYVAARVRATIASDQSVASTPTCAPGVAVTKSMASIAMLYGSWPLAHPADQTRTGAGRRAAHAVGSRWVASSSYTAGSRKNEVSVTVTDSATRSCSSPSPHSRSRVTMASTESSPSRRASGVSRASTHGIWRSARLIDVRRRTRSAT